MREIKTSEMAQVLYPIGMRRIFKRKNIWSAHHFYPSVGGIDANIGDGIADVFLPAIRGAIKQRYNNRLIVILVEAISQPPKGTTVKFKLADNRELVTVRSLLSGKECQIPACDVGSCCDPSTERYHCM